MGRHRLLVLARTLRKFGLVDNFGLSGILQKSDLPIRGRITRMIRESGTLLPPGISARFLAETILNDQLVAEQDSDRTQLLKLTASLTKIPKGPRPATKYQKTMLKIFELLFKDRLGAMKLEETIFSGIKRVDIRAKNDQPTGFFAELRSRFGLHCPRIFFECKNYTEDPGNKEFDQLLGRLNKTSTQVGYVLCREIKNLDKALARCKEAYLREKGEKLMLWLTDADVIELARVLTRDGAAAMDALLEQRLDEVTLK